MPSEKVSCRRGVLILLARHTFSDIAFYSEQMNTHMAEWRIKGSSARKSS